MKTIKKMMSVLALLTVYADTFGVSVDIRGRLGKVTKTQAAVGAGIAGLATGLAAGVVAGSLAARNKTRAQAAKNAAALAKKDAEIAAASPVVNVTIMHPGMNATSGKYMSQPTPVVPVQPTLVSSTESSSQQLETPMLASSTESSSQQLATPTLDSATTASGEELPMVPEISVKEEVTTTQEEPEIPVIPVAVLTPEKKDEIVIADIPVVPSVPVVVEEITMTQEKPETPVIPVAPPAPALPEVSTQDMGSDTQRAGLLEEIRKGKQLKSISSTTFEQEPVIPVAPPAPALPEVSTQDMGSDTQRAGLLEEIRKGKQLKSISSPPLYSESVGVGQETDAQQAEDLPPAYPKEDVVRSTKATEQLSAVLAASPKFQSLGRQRMFYDDDDFDV